MAPRILLPLAVLAAALVLPVSAGATPVNTSPPSISAPVLQVGAPFSVDPGTWTGPGPLRYSYSWSRCVGPNPADCGAASSVDNGDYYVPPTGTVRVKVSILVVDATNAGTFMSVSSGTIVAQEPGAPGTTALPDPHITPAGSGQVEGTVFTANRPAWTPEAASYEYRWFHCGGAGNQCRYFTSTAADPGGTTSTYASGPGDAGTELVVLVTGIASNGTRTSKFSGPTPFIMAPRLAPIVTPKPLAPIAAQPVAPLAMPSVQSRPKVSGVARVGRTLKVKRGTWLAATTFRYRWLRNGAPISGATRTTYRLRRADRGRRISARVTARNATGSVAVRTASLRVR